MSCEHPSVKWRTSKRYARYAVRYGKCKQCGEPIRRIVESASLQRRRCKIADKSPRSPSQSVNTTDNAIANTPTPFEDIMDTRSRILQQITQLDGDSTIRDLQADLDDVRAAIEQHELTVLHRRSAALQEEISVTRMRRERKRDELLRRLEAEEPQVVHDVRKILKSAFERFMLSDPPQQFIPGQSNDDLESWCARGAALSDCCRVLRDLWRAPDALDQLAALIDKHREVLPELRHVQVAETANVS